MYRKHETTQYGCVLYNELSYSQANVCPNSLEPLSYDSSVALRLVNVPMSWYCFGFSDTTHQSSVLGACMASIIPIENDPIVFSVPPFLQTSMFLSSSEK